MRIVQGENFGKPTSNSGERIGTRDYRSKRNGRISNLSGCGRPSYDAKK
ncbi:hypothetical protein C7S14_4030 [Burkholderia cepacia]|nr:hypothetical protein C7S14_4030 [Burkholderia cepacia]